MRQLKYSEAILEATDQCMAKDSNVYLMGLGATDPKGIFGTTLGLEEKYGPKRVMDIPTSENGMTGIAIGSALVGKRPIMSHQRVDFTFLALDQIINNAAKWHYMFGGRMKVPLVIRMVIGRGWGQGPQHSQSLQSIFAHIPGLKVVMPATPYDAKGLLISAVEDDNPVIYMEHRWLHGISGPVPESMYQVPIGNAKVVKEGRDITIVATSYMTLESLQAARELEQSGVQAEVIDVRTLRPLDTSLILDSVRKTGRLIVADPAWRTLGFGAEVLAFVAENSLKSLKASPRRITFPDGPAPSSWALSNHYYPRTIHIVNAARQMMGLPQQTDKQQLDVPLDTPNTTFTGPF